MKTLRNITEAKEAHNGAENKLFVVTRKLFTEILNAGLENYCIARTNLDDKIVAAMSIPNNIEYDRLINKELHRKVLLLEIKRW